MQFRPRSHEEKHGENDSENQSAASAGERHRTSLRSGASAGGKALPRSRRSGPTKEPTSISAISARRHLETHQTARSRLD